MNMRTLFLGLSLAAFLFNGCQETHHHHTSEKEIVEKQYIHKYGVEVTRRDWEERGGDGKVIFVQKNGVKAARAYHSGQLEGESSYTFPFSETIQSREIYKNGVLIKKIDHYMSGMPKKEVQYRENKEPYLVVQWYESGTPYCKEELDGKKIVYGEYYGMSHQVESKVVMGEGTRTVRDGFGAFISLDTISEGVIATKTLHHPNSVPKERVSYSDGMIAGIKTTFYPGGEPNTVEEWSNGRQEGITQVFQNGEKISEVEYKRGNKHGIEKRFRNGKETVEEITWFKNKRQGPSYRHIQGQVETDWYHQGSKVSMSVYNQLNQARIR